MAPPPEYDKEPKAPDKSATNVSCEETKVLHNLVNDQQTNSDNKSSSTAASAEVENNKLVETLDDGQLRALLDEAITYKCPKDREGKSSLFKELLEEVEQDEQASEAAARGLSGSRAGVNRACAVTSGRGSRSRRALPHSNSLQDLVAALAAEPAPRRHHRAPPAPAPAPVSTRAIHGGSLPSGVDTSFLLGEEPARGGGYLATVRCVNPPPLGERRVSTDANCSDTDSLRRSKPAFPMTYTARATLEIGSGAVCSGRAVTTTTASNQVRTPRPHPCPRPRRARAPRPPAPPAAPPKQTLHPHRQRPYIPKDNNRFAMEKDTPRAEVDISVKEFDEIEETNDCHNEKICDTELLDTKKEVNDDLNEHIIEGNMDYKQNKLLSALFPKSKCDIPKNDGGGRKTPTKALTYGTNNTDDKSIPRGPQEKILTILQQEKSVATSLIFKKEESGRKATADTKTANPNIDEKTTAKTPTVGATISAKKVNNNAAVSVAETIVHKKDHENEPDVFKKWTDNVNNWYGGLDYLLEPSSLQEGQKSSYQARIHNTKFHETTKEWTKNVNNWYGGLDNYSLETSVIPKDIKPINQALPKADTENYSNYYKKRNGNTIKEDEQNLICTTFNRNAQDLGKTNKQYEQDIDRSQNPNNYSYSNISSNTFSQNIASSDDIYNWSHLYINPSTATIDFPLKSSSHMNKINKRQKVYNVKYEEKETIPSQVYRTKTRVENVRWVLDNHITPLNSADRINYDYYHSDHLDQSRRQYREHIGKYLVAPRLESINPKNVRSMTIGKPVPDLDTFSNKTSNESVIGEFETYNAYKDKNSSKFQKFDLCQDLVSSSNDMKKMQEDVEEADNMADISVNVSVRSSTPIIEHNTSLQMDVTDGKHIEEEIKVVPTENKFQIEETSPIEGTEQEEGRVIPIVVNNEFNEQLPNYLYSSSPDNDWLFGVDVVNLRPKQDEEKCIEPTAIKNLQKIIVSLDNENDVEVTDLSLHSYEIKDQIRAADNNNTKLDENEREEKSFSLTEKLKLQNDNLVENDVELANLSSNSIGLKDLSQEHYKEQSKDDCSKRREDTSFSKCLNENYVEITDTSSHTYEIKDLIPGTDNKIAKLDENGREEISFSLADKLKLQNDDLAENDVELADLSSNSIELKDLSQEHDKELSNLDDCSKRRKDTSFSKYLAEQQRLIHVLDSSNLVDSIQVHSVVSNNSSINISEKVHTSVKDKLTECMSVSNKEDCAKSHEEVPNEVSNSLKEWSYGSGSAGSSKGVNKISVIQSCNQSVVVLVESANNKIYLTLPKSMVPSENSITKAIEEKENVQLKKKQEPILYVLNQDNTVQQQNDTKKLSIEKPKSKKKNNSTLENAKTEVANKKILKAVMFENNLKSNRQDKSMSSSTSTVSIKEVDSAIPFSCITTPEVVASCNTTASSAQSAVSVDPKPLQLVSSYRAVASLAGIPLDAPAPSALCAPSAPSAACAAAPSADQPRSVITTNFNGLPLTRPHYGSIGNTTQDEYKKSIDENGNSVQGFSSPLSGSSQHKKPRRKKSSKNETVIKSHQIDGYQGNKDLNEVLRFIESAADTSRAGKLGRTKHRDDTDDKGGKKRTGTRKDKESKIKRATSMEELSRTTLEDLTDKPSGPARTPRHTDQGKAERRSWGDDARDAATRFFREEPLEAPVVPDADFQTVTKKRKPRRRADEPAAGDPPRAARPAEPRARRVSAPPSDRSNDSNDDMDSVHSLPAEAGRAPAASYADIARTRHNIPDLIESCNYYCEGEPAHAGLFCGGGGPCEAAGDADEYPALEPRAPRRAPAKPAQSAQPARPRDRKVERAECVRVNGAGGGGGGGGGACDGGGGVCDEGGGVCDEGGGVCDGGGGACDEGGAAAEWPAPDVVADRRPAVILLDSAARPGDMDGVTFGFDINETLLGGGPPRRPRCDLVRDALEGGAPPAPGAAPPPPPPGVAAGACEGGAGGGGVAVRAGCRALRYVPPAPPAHAHTHQLVDYVGAAWEDVMRCNAGKVRYYSE